MSLPEVSMSRLDGDRPIAVVHVRGEIDLASGPAVREALARASGPRGTAVLVDLSECLFIDSTGVSLLLNASRRLIRAGGDLAVVCPNPTPLRVLAPREMQGRV